ncbi:FAD linked oxidase [Macleaya cordata]|uniref:cytokinin dehydrogenase n=1 Tax=Macleaya cordata TaxID=56857 RepID=A0A200QEN7_MACCD|nr:FAD linked oxidase [Macleaya cordata]
MDFGPLKLIQTTDTASLDFGRMLFNTPSAVLRPQSPKDISLLLSFLSASSFSKVTVAAKGAGHSINGQAQALNGIVVEMGSLPSSIKIQTSRNGEKGSFSYVDVSGGTLWVELLEKTLKEGLAPRSWTDYLYLSIGGTLSNAGTGELVTCSPSKSSELFYAALGGLGQFGIITSARILLQEAPKRVKWVRTFYDDFDKFIKDQEMLVVSMSDMVDYVEGFIVLSEESLQSSFIAFPAKLGPIIPQLFQGGTSQVYYSIEFAVHDQSHKGINPDQVVEKISRKMRYMPSLLYSVEVSYFDFLNRVRMEEMNLRQDGQWDVSHPWLNMFVPKTEISQFKDLLLETISSTPFEGPILIYPILRDKWNSNASVVLPESDASGGDKNVIYVVGMLRSANPSTCSKKCLDDFLRQNRQITTTATRDMGGKQYLPHYTGEKQWKEHFGGKWKRFLARKSEFDPLNILAPGQSIFKRKSSSSRNHHASSSGSKTIKHRSQ